MRIEFKRKEDRNQHIIHLYVEKEMELREVGDQVSLSHEQVRTILNQNDVKLRSRGRQDGQKGRPDLVAKVIGSEFFETSGPTLAKKYNTSPATIYDRVKEAGFEPVKKGPRNIDLPLEQMSVDYFINQMSFSELSKKYGHPAMTIWNGFRAAEIPTRKRGRLKKSE